VAPAAEAVLAGALDYAVASAAQIGTAGLGRRSACLGWTVADVLGHATQSLRCLATALDSGAVPEPGPAGCGDLGRAASALLAAARTTRGRIAVDGLRLPCHRLIVVGAIEAAVHAWDAGGPPLPEDLAAALLAELPLVLGRGIRQGLFADPVPLPPGCPAAQRLLAALGRNPADSFSRPPESNR
jgi:uncharacterized protein (TIGR03086 family)